MLCLYMCMCVNWQEVDCMYRCSYGNSIVLLLCMRILNGALHFMVAILHVHACILYVMSSAMCTFPSIEVGTCMKQF